MRRTYAGSPDDEPPESTASATDQKGILSSRERKSSDDSPSSTLAPEPVTRPMTQEKLVAEVNSMYAALKRVEEKCIDLDKAQNFANKQWTATRGHGSVLSGQSISCSDH